MGNFFIDEEDTVGCCHLVIGVVAQCHGDGIEASVLAGSTGQGVGDGIVSYGACNSGGEGWVGFTVGLAKTVSNYGGGLFVDGEDAVGGGHFVVGGAAQGHGNGIGANRVAGGAGQRVGNGIIPHGTGNGGGEGWIGVAVGFAKVVSHHCGGFLRDGEDAVCGVYLVVGIVA